MTLLPDLCCSAAARTFVADCKAHSITVDAAVQAGALDGYLSTMYLYQ
jgi:hypothetical protein